MSEESVVEVTDPHPVVTDPRHKASLLLAGIADLLDQGQIMNRLSIAVTAIGAGVLLIPIFPASTAFVPMGIIVVAVGLIELLVAMRISLDAAIFRRFAAEAAADRVDMEAFDATLRVFRPVSGKGSDRPLSKRLSAAKRLLTVQALLLFLQLVIAALGALAMFMEWV